jgi:hypothetical protein
VRRRALATREMCSRVRLTKTPAEYAETRNLRQELPYEALLASGRDHWLAGERVYVYRRSQGRPGLWQEPPRDETELPSDGEIAAEIADPRDYDVEHYVRVLRDGFASRLARGLNAEDYEAVVSDPDRPPLFARSLTHAKPLLTVLHEP